MQIGRVVLIPSARPPHKPNRILADGGDRLAMCWLAVAGDRLFEVSDWELGQDGPSYTLNTVEHFLAGAPEWGRLHWLVGMDSLRELHGWHRAGELVERCTIVTAARPGAPRPTEAELAERFTSEQARRLRDHVIDSVEIDIAATEIRARVAAGRSIRYLVPEAVRAYISERGLYGAGSASR